MATADAWPGIIRHGLLSTAALLDLFEVDGASRYRIERQRRPESITISHQTHGTATIRDQKPLLEGRLATALADMTVEEYYVFLNQHVFFWPTKRRMLTMLGARAYKGRPQLVLTVDSEALLGHHGSQVLLSHINSGATSPFAWPRGRGTFQNLEGYPLGERIRSYGKANGVAEVLVGQAIIPITNVALAAEIWASAQSVATVWSQPAKTRSRRET